METAPADNKRNSPPPRGMKQGAPSVTSVDSERSVDAPAKKHPSRRFLFGLFGKRTSARKYKGKSARALITAPTIDLREAQSMMLPAKDASVISTCTTKSMQEGGVQSRKSRESWKGPGAPETVNSKRVLPRRPEQAPVVEEKPSTDSSNVQEYPLLFPKRKSKRKLQNVPVQVLFGPTAGDDKNQEAQPALAAEKIEESETQRDPAPTEEEETNDNEDTSSVQAPSPFSVIEKIKRSPLLNKHSAKVTGNSQTTAPNLHFDPPTPKFVTKSNRPRSPRRRRKEKPSVPKTRPDIDLADLKWGSSAAANVATYEPPGLNADREEKKERKAEPPKNIPQMILVGHKKERVERQAQKAKKLLSGFSENGKDWMHDLACLEAEVAKLRKEVSESCLEADQSKQPKEEGDDGSVSSLENDEDSFAKEKAQRQKKKRWPMLAIM